MNANMAVVERRMRRAGMDMQRVHFIQEVDHQHLMGLYAPRTRGCVRACVRACVRVCVCVCARARTRVRVICRVVPCRAVQPLAFALARESDGPCDADRRRHCVCSERRRYQRVLSRSIVALTRVCCFVRQPVVLCVGLLFCASACCFVRRLLFCVV
jgi:hypothetical protein